MDDLRLQAVAARVVAWHNRHPLARRISAQQVRSVGYVALSVGVEGGGLLAPLPASDLAGPAARPAEPPEIPEEDFSAAFAALAEHHAADAQASAQAAAASPPVAAEAEPAPEPPDDGDEGFEIELDVAGDVAPDAAVPEPAALEADAPEADAPEADAPEATAEPAEPTEPAEPVEADDAPANSAIDPAAPAPALPDEGTDAATEAEAGDVATLLAPVLTEHAAPEPELTAPPSLRDRLLHRAQQPAVQGAQLATHDGYRPTVRPPAQPFDPAQLSTEGQPASAWAAEHSEGDRFMAPLSPPAVARWVAQHGSALLQPPQDGPVRHVSTSPVAGGPLSGTTYVLTAAIAGGGLTSRVLVGAGSPGAVLGARLLSLPRVAAAAVLGTALFAGVAVAAVRALRPAESAAAGRPAAHADLPPAAASAASGATDTSDASAAAHASASAPDLGASPAPELVITTVMPVPAYARKGDVGLPLRGFSLSDDDKAAAREAVVAARTGWVAAPRDAAADPSAATGQDPVIGARAGAAPPAAAAAGPTYAISTRNLRTRAEAEQLQVAISALLPITGASDRRVELLPEGEDWRVVAWPFAGSAEADRVRALLAGRGMKVEVVPF